MTDDASNPTTDRAWWRDSWPYLLVVLLATGSFGLLGGLVISSIVWWLGRWRRAQVVIFWVLIPCLLVTFMVAKSTQKERAHDWVMAEFTPKSQPADPSPTSSVSSSADSVNSNNNAGGPGVRYQSLTEAAPGIGNESRCERNDSQTGECLAWATPPAGYHWDNSPTIPVAGSAEIKNAESDASALAPTWVQLLWNAETAKFMADFPAVASPMNSVIFQEKLNLLYSPSKSNRQKLEDAYNASVADARWQPVTQVDRDAELTHWNSDSADFVQSHPDINYRGNTKILQEYLDSMARSNLTNVQMMELSYRVALVDSRWASSP